MLGRGYFIEVKVKNVGRGYFIEVRVEDILAEVRSRIFYRG